MRPDDDLTLTKCLHWNIKASYQDEETRSDYILTFKVRCAGCGRENLYKFNAENIFSFWPGENELRRLEKTIAGRSRADWIAAYGFGFYLSFYNTKNAAVKVMSMV